MALIAFDGFDNYAANGSDLLTRRGGGWQWNAQAGGVSLGEPGRNGVGAQLQLYNGASLTGIATTPLAVGFFGFALKCDVFTQFNPSIVLIDTPSSAAQVTVVFNLVTGGIDVYSGGWNPYGGSSLIGSTPNNALSYGGWNYIEVRAFINATAGSVIIQCNGETILSLSNVNTQPNAGARLGGVQLGGTGAGYGKNVYIDDFYFADTTVGAGAFPFSSFVGDVRVVPLAAIGNGASTQWTPLTGANWQEVAEAQNDGDASYVSTMTVGAKDLYNFAALPPSVLTVLAVEAITSARQNDAGDHSVQQHLVSGATEVTGVSTALASTYAYIIDSWTTDPATGAAWTVAGVNALQAGPELSA